MKTLSSALSCLLILGSRVHDAKGCASNADCVCNNNSQCAESADETVVAFPGDQCRRNSDEQCICNPNSQCELMCMDFEVTTATDIVENVLKDPNGFIEFQAITSSNHACFESFTNGHVMGNFLNTTNPLIPDGGVIMGTGKPRDFCWDDSRTTNHIFNEPGDVDLDNLPGFGAGMTEDACFIQFDFRCTGEFPEMSFNYVWGSDEYNENIDGDVDDTFAFFLEGDNIAVLPDGATPVTIDNINSSRNSLFYVDNREQGLYPIIEADGFTTKLKATGTINDGGWKTLKLVIADVGDAEVDSYVLLEAGSLTCVDPASSPTPSASPSFGPSISSAPSVSQKPSVSTQPSASAAPSVSANPSVSIVPSVSQKPSVSAQPSVSAAPSVSTNPSVTSQPTVSSEPSVSAAPSISTKPTVSTQPTSSSKPTVSAAPSVTQMPSVSQGPSIQPSDAPTPQVPGIITGTIFEDLNRDGIRSSDENGLPHIEVELWCARNGHPATKVATDITDAHGGYTFSVDPPGRCFIQVDTDGYLSSPIVSGGNQLGPDGSSSGVIVSYRDVITIDGGLLLAVPGIIKGTIFNDLDRDGIQDPHENGLPHIVIALWCSRNGHPAVKIATDITDSNGFYAFSVDPPGTCFIQVDTNGYRYGVVVSGGNQLGPDGASPEVFVDYRDHIMINGGLYLPDPGIIRGTIFEDLDRDGIRDSHENGLPNIVIALWCARNGHPASKIATDITDAHGAYEFSVDPPGTCFVEVESDGYLYSPVVSGGNQIGLQGRSPDVDVDYEDVIVIDGGILLAVPGIIKGTMFEDLNQDGIRDSHENGLPGIVVELWCARNGHPAAKIATDITDAHGAYEFSVDPPGTCFIQVDDKSYTYSLVVSGGNQLGPHGRSPDVDVDYRDVICIDGGITLPIPGIIRGTIFEDLNQDGIRDSHENGLPGIVVELWCSRYGHPAAKIATETTDAHGAYTFSVDPPGTCFVEVEPEGYTYSPIVSGGNQLGPDGRSPEVHVNYDVVIVIDGGINLPTPGIISGTIFEDLNQDGIYGPQENGLPNIVIALWCVRNRQPAVKVATDTTDSSGVYMLGVSPPGRCFIRVETDGYLYSPVVSGGNQLGPDGRSAEIDVDYSDVVKIDGGLFLPFTLECVEQCDVRDEHFDCGWGIWNPCTCQCDCDPGFCLSANQKCYDGCTTHLDFNPFGGCRPGMDCPWYPDKLGAAHCTSSQNFAGIYNLHESAEKCCGDHFSAQNVNTCAHNSVADVEAQEQLTQDRLDRPRFYWPDLYGKKNCVFDSGYDDWMEDQSEHYLFDNEVGCCGLWYPNEPNCPEVASPTTPLQLDYNPDASLQFYYPHLSESNCRFGRNYPMWMKNSPKHYLYTTPEECCNVWYEDEPNCPMVEDDGVQEGFYWTVDEAFYPNFNGNWCAQGNSYPEWMADPMERDMHLFTTGQACCDRWFPDDTVECQSNIVTVIDGVQIAGPDVTGTWYPILNGQVRCIDGTPPSWMTQVGYEDEYVFNSHSECCKAHRCEAQRGTMD